MFMKNTQNLWTFAYLSISFIDIFQYLSIFFMSISFIHIYSLTNKNSRFLAPKSSVPGGTWLRTRRQFTAWCQTFRWSRIQWSVWSKRTLENWCQNVFDYKICSCNCPIFKIYWCNFATRPWINTRCDVQLDHYESASLHCNYDDLLRPSKRVK